jgi:hypothetical protein
VKRVIKTIPAPLLLTGAIQSVIIPNAHVLSIHLLDLVYHDEILNDFNSVNGKTTFFMNGDNWSCIYDQDNVDAIRLSVSPLNKKFM